MIVRAFFFFTIHLAIFVSYSQIAPCGNNYGTSATENNIVEQMRYGSINDAVDAINLGKNARGSALGCTEIVINYSTPNLTEPTLMDIENIWNTVHAPSISSLTINCPRIGRYENNSALGAYYAMHAGYFNDTTILAEIGDMMHDQQFSECNAVIPNPRNEGVYGYINVGNLNACYPGGVVGSSVSTLCSTLPEYCVTYTGGQFAGENFAISGQDDANNWFDGGLAYDHGWVGIQMIEASIQQNSQTLKQKYRKSVRLAGQYAISEHCVKNHNYTAKLTWLLAELYAWTGDSIYSNALNYKLNKNLIPGILMDLDNDGFVDGTSPQIAFNTLTVTAQQPGRMWDGHNSIPWYQAMNTWTMIESYVAFRDRGDTDRAAELKPYAIAMLDNLANEIINEGVISTDALGVRDITYALLIGIWKVSQYENQAHLNWEQAAWAMWNTGYFDNYNTHSVCVGLYLTVKTNTPYIPIAVREDFSLSIDDTIECLSSIKIFPNPANDYIYINLAIIDDVQNTNYAIYNLQGKIVLEGSLASSQSKIAIKHLNKGTYSLVISKDNQLLETLRLVKI
jgi:hypothetical protein